MCHDDVMAWKRFPFYWPFCEETAGHRWIPQIVMKTWILDVFLCVKSKQFAVQTVQVIWDAVTYVALL